MGIHFKGSSDKLSQILLNSPLGLIEITSDGEVVNKNRVGKEFFLQLCRTYNCGSDHVYDLLQHIDHKIVDLIHHFQEPSGLIFSKSFAFTLPQPEKEEKYFTILVSKVMENSYVVALEDNTEKQLREKAMQQSELEKAIAQGKYEIASEVLHDIGNAVVGFGAYLNRVNRMLDKNKPDNPQNVAMFVKNVQSQIAVSIGADKASALVTLLEGIAKNERENKEELRKSVTEQLNIISHIQEILTIQRQYVVGHEAHERKPVNLKQVIDNCMSMLFASFDKKNIQVNIHISDSETPVIKGDRTKLMQVILNLLKNSIEAIDAEAPVKKIDIQLLHNHNTVELDIKDSGKGFEEGTACRFFQRGYTTKGTGTGLGLYNCKQIIEAHAGTIHMNSKGIGQGAAIHIRFQQ